MTVKIFKKDTPDDNKEYSDLKFGLKLSNISPSPGAKLSNKRICEVSIVTDKETKKRNDAIARMLKTF